MTFEIIKTFKEDEVSTLKLVKLSETKNVRFVGEKLFGEVDYVLYGTSRVELEDDTIFEETTITACDSEGEFFVQGGEVYQAFLYYSLRSLSVEEAMFMIGELEYVQES